MYITSKQIREFEDKFGFEKLCEWNEMVGKFLNFEPKIEYCVSRNGGSCYSPSNVGSYFSDWQSQKRECERWLKEQHEKHPNGWVVKEGFETTRYEWYPTFYSDWNHMIEAIKRLSDRNIKTLKISCDIFEMFLEVSNYCH